MLAEQQSPCFTSEATSVLRVVSSQTQPQTGPGVSVYRQELELFEELECVAVLSEN